MSQDKDAKAVSNRWDMLTNSKWLVESGRLPSVPAGGAIAQATWEPGQSRKPRQGSNTRLTLPDCDAQARGVSGRTGTIGDSGPQEAGAGNETRLRNDSKHLVS